MTRYFGTMWEYKTQVMDFFHAESFLARLLLKKHNLYISICDKNGHPVAGVRYTDKDVYQFGVRYNITGMVFYDTHYRVKINSLGDASLVPIH